MTVMDPREIVAAKRDGKTLSPGEVSAFVEGYTAGSIDDALAAAFLMATLLNGFDPTETLAMTRAMIASGDTVAFPGLSLPTVDKHSTGGVADGVTLAFAPLAAALGMGVAKLSGRGLGHTGGTLDKLEAIPGLRTDLTPHEIERQVDEVGCAVAAPTSNLVPADGALYALRDATATVPSIPLIAASVMSKKLAVETDLVMLDVKAGSGAFMKTVDDAKALAEACLELAKGWGRPARAAVTDMSQPLGDAVGNALDVAEAIELLSGRRRGRLRELTVVFAAQGASSTLDLEFNDAVRLAEAAIDDGHALERFGTMIAAQGGDRRVIEDPWAILPSAPVIVPITIERDGVVARMDAEAIGWAGMLLGAGRLHKGDPIDPATGLVVRAKVADRLSAGEPIGEVHARDSAAGEEAARRVLDAVTLTDEDVEAPPLVHGWFG